jgi:hypothetical protein
MIDLTDERVRTFFFLQRASMTRRRRAENTGHCITVDDEMPHQPSNVVDRCYTTYLEPSTYVSKYLSTY